MAVIARNNGFSLTWRFDGKQKWIATNCRTKGEAQRLERQCLTALDARNFSFISEDARHILVRLHKLMGWVIPDELIKMPPQPVEPTEKGRRIVLWNEERPEMGGAQIFLDDPIIKLKKDSAEKRYRQCFHHLKRILEADIPVGEIYPKQLRKYYAARITEGAAPNTIGREISALSMMFTVLISDPENGITGNPCDLVRGKGSDLNFDSKERQSYLSYETVQFILGAFNENTENPLIPRWLKPMIICSYYTGMRLNEVVLLKRKQIFLDKRMIYLAIPEEIKERKPKRIPIRKELHDVLEPILASDSCGYKELFLLSDQQGTRPVTEWGVKSVFRRMVPVLRPEPRFSFNDLRHTFKANCARSGIPERISERILGHSNKNGYLTGRLSVNHRYGAISDKEFIDAIDRLTVDHGDSEIDDQPLVLKPVSYLLAGNEKQDVPETGILLSS